MRFGNIYERYALLPVETKEKFQDNIIKFTAPVLCILFAQLATGVNPRAAALVALYALYGILADFFKKLSESHI